MNYTHMTNAELVRHVDNTPRATPLERALAQRLDEVTEEVKMVESQRDTAQEEARVLKGRVREYE